MDITHYHRIQKLRRTPPGRGAQAADNVQQIAEPLGYPQLTPFTEAVVEAARFYVDLRGRRLAQRDARGDGEAAEIDKPIDTRVGFIHDTCRKYAVEMPHSEEGRAGKYVLRRYFGRGLKAIVNVSFEEELILVEHVAHGLRTVDARLVDILTIEHHVAALEELLPRYRAALAVEDKVTAGELGAAYEALQMRYLDLVWAIVTLVRDDAHRAALLAPIFEQDDRIAAVYAARRRGQAPAESLDLDAEADELLDDELAEADAARAAEEAGEAPADAEAERVAAEDADATPDGAPADEAPGRRPLTPLG